MKKLNKSTLKRVVISANRVPRLEFRKFFSNEIDEFTDAAFKAYQQYDLLREHKNNRESVVKLYAFTAMQNLVSAFNIFISGYLIPAGNLMRHFHESIAWAILFSTKKLDFYENFKKNKKDTIKFSSGPLLVKDNIDKFNINTKGWDTFIKIRNFYHNASHSTLFAAASNIIFSEKSSIALGSHFDKEKLSPYKKEITTMINAAKILENIIMGIIEQIKEENLLTTHRT